MRSASSRRKTLSSMPWAAALGLFLLCALAPWAHAQAPSAAGREAGPLYFAMELRHEGKVIASPKLLGSPGQWVRAERRQPGAKLSDYKLSLLPTLEGGSYRIDLDVMLPRSKNARGQLQAFALGHGEERRVELSDELEVSMLVMRVNSPEFEALMRLASGEEAKQPETI